VNALPHVRNGWRNWFQSAWCAERPFGRGRDGSRVHGPSRFNPLGARSGRSAQTARVAPQNISYVSIRLVRGAAVRPRLTGIVGWVVTSFNPLGARSGRSAEHRWDLLSEDLAFQSAWCAERPFGRGHLTTTSRVSSSFNPLGARSGRSARTGSVNNRPAKRSFNPLGARSGRSAESARIRAGRTRFNPLGARSGRSAVYIVI
jgi:hypothetical protein